jgi:alpha-ribazole phosphatase
VAVLIYLLRHGATAHNAERRYQGSTDAPLSPEGRAALHPADFSPERVYVSPLSRAAETAALLFPGAAQTVVPALREMDFGAFEGRNYQEMAQDGDYRAWVEGGCTGRCPGGEDLAEFSARTCAAFEALVDGALAAGEDRLVIVAHGGTQMAVLSRYAAPHRDYFSWQAPCGGGFLLDAARWPAARTLALSGELQYAKD